jgi:hypothetical protein
MRKVYPVADVPWSNVTNALQRLKAGRKATDPKNAARDRKRDHAVCEVCHGFTLFSFKGWTNQLGIIDCLAQA